MSPSIGYLADIFNEILGLIKLPTRSGLCFCQYKVMRTPSVSSLFLKKVVGGCKYASHDDVRKLHVIKQL